MEPDHIASFTVKFEEAKATASFFFCLGRLCLCFLRRDIWNLGLEVISVDGLEFFLDGGSDQFVLLHLGLANEKGRLDDDVVHLSTCMEEWVHELVPTVTSSTLI